MTELKTLYESWMIEGCYFNQMLDCGDRYNPWVEIALGYLPVEVLDENKENLVFISTAQRDACRVARYYCENREVVLLSELQIQAQEDEADNLAYEWFNQYVIELDNKHLLPLTTNEVEEAQKKIKN